MNRWIVWIGPDEQIGQTRSDGPDGGSDRRIEATAQTDGAQQSLCTLRGITPSVCWVWPNNYQNGITLTTPIAISIPHHPTPCGGGGHGSPLQIWKPFWRLPGRHTGGVLLGFQYKSTILEASRPTYWGVWGGGCPPGIKLSCVFSQPRASSDDPLPVGPKAGDGHPRGGSGAVSPGSIL